ncbi:MAG: ABC-2 transporter permease [Roseburia sp.]|nr:ABC-2 transporter permease [Roseburia sp.]
MRGLLLKDWLVIGKQAKHYFIMMIVFAMIPGVRGYAIFFGALLPMTAFSYDERSHWDAMARMMPYSFGNVVAEKYIFGYLIVGGIVLLETMSQIVYCLAGVGSLEIWVSIQEIWISAAVALSLMALQIPVIFWLGVEKTRMFLTLVFVIAMMSVLTVYSPMMFFVSDETVPKWRMPVVMLLWGFAIIWQFVSIVVSKKVYRRSLERKK